MTAGIAFTSGSPWEMKQISPPSQAYHRDYTFLTVRPKVPISPASASDAADVGLRECQRHPIQSLREPKPEQIVAL